MAKKILFFSFKGGVGVTTFCAGLGAALASRGERVLLADGDFRCGAALTVCGCDGMQVYTAADAERGACRAKQTLLQHPKERNLFILPMLGSKDGASAASLIGEVEQLFDYVLCDRTAAEICDDAAVITEPYAPSVKSADAALAYLKDGGFSSVGLVVNKMNGGLVFDGESLTPQEIASLLRAKLRAAIPEDLSLPLGKHKKSTAAAFAAAADNFAGKTDKIYSVIKPYYGVNGFLKRKMRSGL